jgi:hypothetical protein
MIEFVKHALGLCGEHWHPNLFTIIVSGFGLLPAFEYFKYKYFKNGRTK